MPAAIDPTAIDDIIGKLGITPASPGCSIAIVKGNEHFSRGYGMADLDHGLPNAPGTVFHAASLAKQFTAVAIMLLVKDGCISLDTNVHDYIPELAKLRPLLPNITIEQLLHHKSGIRDQWALLTAAGWRGGDEVAAAEDVLRLLRDMATPNFKPDADWSYSNTNYFLAGLIVERANQKTQSLADFAQERIFSRLGMSGTRFVETHGETVKDRAYGYRKIEHKNNVFRFEKTMPNYSLTGPTNLVTTVEDLVTWDRNFDAPDGVGGEDVIRQMLHPVRRHGGFGYGLGLYVLPDDVPDDHHPQIFYHDGIDPGHCSHLIRYNYKMSGELTVALLFNFELKIDTLGISDDIADSIRATPTARHRSQNRAAYSGTVSTPGLKAVNEYTGQYRSDEIDTTYEVKLDVESGNLMLLRHRHPWRLLEPSGADEFRVNGFAERTLKTVTMKFLPGSGTMSGFLLSDCRGRMRNLPFRRLGF